MMQRSLSLSLILLVSVMTMGCTTVQKYAAGGALVGATVGGIWGSNGGGLLNAGEGAAIGAAGGGLIGALIGDAMDNSANDMIAERDAQIAALQEENRRLKNEAQACQEELAAAKRRIEDLTNQIANMGSGGDKIEMTLLSDVLFEPGSAVLSSSGKSALSDAAAKIKSEYGDQFVTVEGHTDSDPIKYSGWKDNWELGCARSLAVLRYLIGQGINPEHASAETFSYYQPVASNDTAEGKAQNRRSVIVLHSGYPKQ